MGKRAKIKPPVIRKSNGLRNALITSLVLHLLLLAGLSLGKSGAEGSEGESKADSQSHSEQENIIEKPQDKVVEVDIIPQKEGDVPTPKPKEEVAKKDCTGFGGIGIEFSSKSGLVGRVFKGYPADKAGIESGDHIVSPGMHEIKGEVGTNVTLQIIRYGELHEVVITRELICTDKIQGDK